MTQTFNQTSSLHREQSHPQGRVLTGQYAGAFRSEKGKLKGLLLRSDEGEYAIKLPKYLRPILVRELVPNAFIQVWAYPEDGMWRGINVLPLPEAEQQVLQQRYEVAQVNDPVKTSSQKATVCIQVCRKGKCFKQGSQAIWRALQAEVERDPNLQHVSIEATGCMKACKQGPNLRVLPAGKLLNRANQSVALEVLSKYS